MTYAHEHVRNTFEVTGDNETDILQTILAEIMTERMRQDAKWGEQNHAPVLWHAILGEECGEVAAETLALAFNYGYTAPLSLADHLRRNYSTDRHYAIERYRTELIQTAAVAIAALEASWRVKQ